MPVSCEVGLVSSDVLPHPPPRLPGPTEAIEITWEAQKTVRCSDCTRRLCYTRFATYSDAN